MRRVVVAVDGSEMAKKAVEYTLEQFQGEDIRFVHVLDQVGDYAADPTCSDPVERAESEAEALFEKLGIDELEAEGTVKTETVVGHPVKSLLSYADTHDIDHIVVGSRGKRGAKRILLGSVAETVLRRADCPVTVVR